MHALGRTAEARQLFEQLKVAIPDEPIIVSMTAVYASADGRRDEARRLLDQLALRDRSSFVEPMYVAAGYAAIGDMEAASHWLQQARDAHSALLPMIAVDPVWRPFLDDPRVRAVLAALNLAPRVGGRP